ncbi:MAG: hypothetical protein Q8L60_04780 [Gammaproteobacteria bacterium]|nr:hypothetical protein [Gammaproteobacteria bacterium]MDP2346969.1 hypothetical protein [Gammaproteobacteria bacterium]
MSIRIFAVLIAFVLSSCSSNPTVTSGAPPLSPADTAALLHDEFFTDDSAANFQPVEIYALTDSITAYLDEHIVNIPNEERRYRELRRWIFDLADQYEYDPEVTSSIADLERIGIINCFSFSNLYVAAARHVSVPADFQLVYTPPSWGASNQTWVLNQHVNVSGRINRVSDNGSLRLEDNLPMQTGTHINPTARRSVYIRYVVDLNPRIVVDAYRTETLQDHQVLSLYYSNKAAEALFENQLGLAYQYAKHAVLADSSSATALNTLGVLYGRVNQTALARAAYTTAIAMDPDADSARSNLASLYNRIGEARSAEQMQERLKQRRERNPYYHYNMGEDMRQAGAWMDAIVHYRAAIRRKKEEQLFYLSMAEAQLRLQQLRDAERSLRQAERYADRDNAERYAELQRALAQATGG